MWQKNKGVIVALIVGLILGYGAGASWGRGGAATGIGGALGEVATSTNQLAAVVESSRTSAGDPLQVQDQAAGNQVKVARVMSDKPVWVAVRENKDGVAGGAVLGATLLPLGGDNKDVMIDLLTPTTASAKYHLSLYVDDGDQLFSSQKDELLKDASGQIIDASFNTE